MIGTRTNLGTKTRWLITHVMTAYSVVLCPDLLAPGGVVSWTYGYWWWSVTDLILCGENVHCPGWFNEDVDCDGGDTVRGGTTVNYAS